MRPDAPMPGKRFGVKACTSPHGGLFAPAVSSTGNGLVLSDSPLEWAPMSVLSGPGDENVPTASSKTFRRQAMSFEAPSCPYVSPAAARVDSGGTPDGNVGESSCMCIKEAVLLPVAVKLNDTSVSTPMPPAPVAVREKASLALSVRPAKRLGFDSHSPGPDETTMLCFSRAGDVDCSADGHVEFSKAAFAGDFTPIKMSNA